MNMRAESLKSILDNWYAIDALWDQSLDEKLDPEIRGRIIRVQSQMHLFNYFFGVYILQLLLRHSDNLSKSLQNQRTSACNGHSIAALSIKTLEKSGRDDTFDLLWHNVMHEAELLD